MCTLFGTKWLNIPTHEYPQTIDIKIKDMNKKHKTNPDNVLVKHIPASCICDTIEDYLSVPDRCMLWMKREGLVMKDDIRVVDYIVRLYDYDPYYIIDDREDCGETKSTVIMWVHKPSFTTYALKKLQPRTLILVCLHTTVDVTQIDLPDSVKRVVFICPWLQHIQNGWLLGHEYLQRVVFRDLSSLKTIGNN